MIDQLMSQLPSESAQQAVTYPSLFLLVALGALVPVVPTGAVVSSAAVVAFHQTAPLALLYIFVVASFAAFLGDISLYWLGRRGVNSKNGSRWLAALERRVADDTLDQAQRKLREHGVTVLVLSRLVPAGRIPVMLACLLSRWSTMRFIKGALPACLAWAATYQLIGILGGSLFEEAWEGVVAAVALTVLISGGPAVWRRLRGHGKGAVGKGTPGDPAAACGSTVADGPALAGGSTVADGPSAAEGRTVADGPAESDGQQA